MDQRWADGNFDPNAIAVLETRPPQGFAHRAGPRILAIAPPASDAACLDDLVLHAGARLLGQVAVVDAVERLNQIACVDLVWMIGETGNGIVDWSPLVRALIDRDCPLICEMPMDGVDIFYGLFSSLERTVFLCQPTALDRQVALASVVTDGRAFVRDVASDAVQDRIDQLQEEVARISRLLVQLAHDRGDFGPLRHMGMDADGRASPDVRSPVRSFTPQTPPRGFEPAASPQRQRARLIRQMIRRRRVREQFFPADLFADPAWDMLLDLYAAKLEGHPVSVSSLCIAAAVPATTALRWIKMMTDAGVFERRADPRDGRRVFIGMSTQTDEAMARYFEALEE